MTAAGVGLVFASLLLDLPSALLRLAVAAILLGALVNLGGAADAISALFAFGPALRSLLALALPLPAGVALRAASGARRPSGREGRALAQAFALLPGVAPARSVLVVDSPEENAWVMGTTLFLSRGLFDSPHLVAVLSHETGHLVSRDGRVALAAWWLPVRSLAWLAQRLIGGQPPARFGPARSLPQPGQPRQPAAVGAMAPRRAGAVLLRLPAICLGACLLVVSGGLLPMLLRPLWSPYRRGREYAADAFAAQRGLGAGLADALLDWQVLDIAVPWWQGRSHPYVEQRLDRLRRGGS